MLPNLDNAQPTLHSLHSAALLLKPLRQLCFERQPNFIHLGLKVTPDGVSTDLLPSGSEITLDYRQLALIYQPASGAAVSISLNGRTQADLFETLLQTVYAGELTAIIPHNSGDTFTDDLLKVAPTLTNRSQPKREDVSGQTPMQFDVQAANAYADAFYSLFTGMARFKARLNGSMTPILVWPEHFDASFLWFKDQPDEQHPHLNFGFAPFSYGINYPYLYAYAYPYPTQFDAPKLPAGARWNSEGWTGVILPYSEIERQNDPALYVESSCEAIFRSLNTLLG